MVKSMRTSSRTTEQKMIVGQHYVCSEDVQTEPETSKKLEAGPSRDQFYTFDEKASMDYLKHMLQEEQFRGVDLGSDADLQEIIKSDQTPVFADNACILYFKDKEEEKGNLLKTINTQYGEFIAVPNSKFEEFLSISESLPKSLLLPVNPATLMFAMQQPSVNAVAISKNVWMISEQGRKCYDKWIEEKKKLFAVDN